MPRQGLDPERVVEAAAALADAEGIESVTLARVASALGVRPPSLYNHVASLDGLLQAVALRALRNLGTALAAATVGRSGEDAVIALARAYRRWAAEHPGSYASTLRAPDPDDDERAAAGAQALSVLLSVLRPWHPFEEDAVHAARALRSGLHGFVALERAGGFGLPLESDVSFDRLVAALAAGLSRPSPEPGGEAPTV